MKKILIALVLVLSVARGFAFVDGVDDQTVLYKSIIEWFKTSPAWDNNDPNPIGAKRLFDLMIQNGADPNKTMYENKA